MLVEDTFAVKGCIAINMLARDGPRLPVADHTLPRDEALRHGKSGNDKRSQVMPAKARSL